MKRRYPDLQGQQEQALRMEGELCAILDAMDGEGWAYSTENCGASIQRAWFYPAPMDREVTQDEVANLRRAVHRSFPDREFKWTRRFREKEGTFYWFGEAKEVELPSGECKVWVFIEHAPRGKCEVRKVTKTVEVFETDCKPETEAQ